MAPPHVFGSSFKMPSFTRKGKEIEKSIPAAQTLNLAQAMGDQSVIIYVGPERKRYLVHKVLLTRQSDYFDRALNGRFREADEQEITLEEESPAAFELLIGWLYQDRIPVVGSSLQHFKAKVFDTSAGTSARSTYGVSGRPSALSAPYFGSSAFPSSFSLFGNNPQITQVEMAAFTSPLPNEGTGHVSYQPTIENQLVPAFGAAVQTQTPLQDIYHSISAQSQYIHWAVEELRLADYNAGRRDTSGTSGLSPFADLALADKHKASTDSSAFTEGSFTPFQNIGRIPGIPQCPSIQGITETEEQHQLAVLQLCLLAEVICWTDLFNRAMTVYISGEGNLSYRPIRPDHIELIYQRAHDESPMRAYAADAAVSKLRDPAAQEQYLELINEYPTFLKDIFKSLAKWQALSLRDPTSSPQCQYHIHEFGQHCAAPKDSDTSPPAVTGLFAQRNQTKSDVWRPWNSVTGSSKSGLQWLSDED